MRKCVSQSQSKILRWILSVSQLALVFPSQMSIVTPWDGITLVFLGITSGVKNEPYPIEWKDRKDSFYSSSTHAEMKTMISHLRRKRKHVGRRKSHCARYDYCKFPKTLVVIYVYKGNLRYSRPCDACIQLMRMYGIKRVIYSSGETSHPYYMENVMTMLLMGNSRGDRP